MSVGSGGSARISGDVQAALRLVENSQTLEIRLKRLAKAQEEHDLAARNAKRAIKVAEAEAKDKADAILKAAEEQAQDRLGAIEDLQKALAEEQRAWELEKSEEQSKLRSDRSKLSAATRKANEEAATAQEARKALDKARADYEVMQDRLNAKYEQMQEIWRG